MNLNATKSALCLVLSLGFACTKATGAGDEGTGARPPPPRPLAAEVSVELSAVTLGEECGASWSPPAPAQPPAPAKTAIAPAEPASMAAPSRRARAAAECATPGDCGRGYRDDCNQTSIQLALQAPAAAAPTTIRIKKVELLDAKGALIGELASKSPTKWSDVGNYQPWDQTIAPGESAAVSYVLASPEWDKLEGGRYGQHAKTFHVRVTVLVGSKDRVVEKQSVQATIRPPAVPT